MKIFDRLNSEYKTSHARVLDDQNASLAFACKFADEFKTYIEAPESYEGHDSKQKPYVEPLKITEYGDDALKAAEPDGYYDLIHRGRDGYWRYGIGVTLETNPRGLPKAPFTILIHFMIEDGHCKMLIADRTDGKFDFEISDVANYETAFDFIVELLSQCLSAKPSDQVQEKWRAGFVLSTRRAEL